jgi:hypothetical protein
LTSAALLAAACCPVLAREQGFVSPLEELGVAATLLIERVQPPHEEQIADLFDRGQRIGNATGPEFVPQGVNPGTKSCIQHALFLTCS